MDPYAKHPFLRSTLAFKYAWWYYAAILIDPILRFNWIFYAIYANNTQHSSLVSFFVAFSEVLRRGMWTLFRVENEHCTKYASICLLSVQSTNIFVVLVASGHHAISPCHTKQRQVLRKVSRARRLLLLRSNHRQDRTLNPKGI